MSILESQAQAQLYISQAADRERDDAVKALFAQAGELYHKKLWYNLTGVVRQLCQVPRFQAKGEGSLQVLYSKFVKDFENKVNRLELAKIGVATTRTIASADEAFAFLDGFKGKFKETDNEALALCFSELALIRVAQGNSEEGLELAQKAESAVLNMEGIDPEVSALHYRALSRYHSSMGNSKEFYRAALLMLLFHPADQMEVEARTDLAYEMGVAVLTSSDIVNFGELLANPIFEALKTAPADRAWLADVLTAVNGGQRARFEELVKVNAQHVAADKSLAAGLDRMREKIALLAIVELLFTKSAGDRTVSFAAVARACECSDDQVEMLIMRAMSLGLIKGSLDEVQSTVTVSWVQPRVLDMQQIALLRDRLAQWKQTVADVVRFVQTSQSA